MAGKTFDAKWHHYWLQSQYSWAQEQEKQTTILDLLQSRSGVKHEASAEP